MNIKYQDNCNIYNITFSENGEWIDLKTICDIEVEKPTYNTKTKTINLQTTTCNLGIAMQLPKDFEAIVAPRSSTFEKYGLLLTNSIGIIDSSFCGPNDTWKFKALCFKNAVIPAGTRIAQFRIQPSQKANAWTKIKWLFTSRINFEKVDKLKNPNRGGFGSTGN